MIEIRPESLKIFEVNSRILDRARDHFGQRMIWNIRFPCTANPFKIDFLYEGNFSNDCSYNKKVWF